MMHKAWSSIEEVPYCFSRSSIKFQCHTGQKIADLDPSLAFPDGNSSLNSLMAMIWCTPSMLGFGDMDVLPFWPPFWHSGDLTRSFWGTFSHPPTWKLSFGVLKLPILTEFDLFGPKFHFFLDLFGSNFQQPVGTHPFLVFGLSTNPSMQMR